MSTSFTEELAVTLIFSPPFTLYVFPAVKTVEFIFTFIDTCCISLSLIITKYVFVVAYTPPSYLAETSK